MDAVNSFLGQIGSTIQSLQNIELGISYLYVIIFAFLLLLTILFNSKKGLVLVGTAMVFYLGVLKGYPYIAESLERQPLFWILYLVVGLIYLLAIGLTMFMDR